MLTKNRFTGYLIYAIGEIILVVIGILIALQINNWNERQKDRAQTRVYMNNLIDDLKKDEAMYDDQIKAAQVKYQYCKELHEILIDRKPVEDTSAFIIRLQAVGRLLLPAVNDNIYKELLSTGSLKLINDKKSIDAIREYYSNNLEWWYDDYKNQLVNGYLPLAVDAIPMHLHEEILGNETVHKTQDFTDKALLNNVVKNYSRADILEIRKALENNKDFAFQLKRITRSHLVHVKILGLGKNAAENLLQTLGNWSSLNKARSNA